MLVLQSPALPGSELIWFIFLGTLVFTLVAFFFVLQIMQGQQRAWKAKKDTMEAIQEREEKYRDLFDNVNDIVYIHSLEGVMMEVNASGAALLGKPIQEIVGKGLTEFFGDELASRLGAYIGLLTRSGRARGVVAMALTGKSTQYIEYSSSVIRKDGKPVAVRGIARNISDKRRAEQALRQSEKRFRDLVRYSPMAMLILTGRRISYANKAAITLLKAKNADELLGASIDRFILYDVLDPDMALSKMLAAGETPHIVTERLRQVDGEIREIESASLPVLFQGSEALHLVIRDITETKRYQASLRELPHQIFKAQETERRRVARDLHDSVNQMLGILQFRLQASEMNFGEMVNGLREDLTGIRSDIEKASDEVKRICQGLRPSLLDDFGLPAAVKSLSASLSARRGIAIETLFDNLPSRLEPEVEIGLFRIVQEALNNLEKHSGATAATINVSFVNEHLRVHITDNGRGIAPASLQNGRGDKPRGMGLGSMRERATAMGGLFSIDPGYEGGTVIEVTIPYTSARNVPELVG